MLARFFGYYRKNQVLARFSTFRTFRLCLTLSAILATRVANTRNTGNSNPKILAARTPEGPRRPYDRSPEGLTTVARRPLCDRGPEGLITVAYYYHRYTYNPRHSPSTTPGNTPARESAKSTEFGV